MADTRLVTEPEPCLSQPRLCGHPGPPLPQEQKLPPGTVGTGPNRTLSVQARLISWGEGGDGRGPGNGHIVAKPPGAARPGTLGMTQGRGRVAAWLWAPYGVALGHRVPKPVEDLTPVMARPLVTSGGALCPGPCPPTRSRSQEPSLFSAFRSWGLGLSVPHSQAKPRPPLSGLPDDFRRRPWASGSVSCRPCPS